MKQKIYIDGQEGTTGLQIYDRLFARDDIELLLIDEEKRKDINERKRLINSADLVFLCLPDSAAIEAISLIENDRTRVIDASTAHRTSPGWSYGFSELSKEHLESIKASRFTANPGCHATGILANVYPLIMLDIMPADYMLSCFSLTGYSGGGKSMINAYTNEKTPEMYAPRLYALDLNHKHLPEIMHVSGLVHNPVFCPVVDDYYAGIAATIMLHNRQLIKQPSSEDIRCLLFDYYKRRYLERPHKITIAPELGSGMLESNWGEGEDSMMITVSGNDELTIVTARFDNLGKGAAGAAVQNMEIMLNLEEKI
jgi:N-acetyl-gamma-glutamyl-phosphate reductase